MTAQAKLRPGLAYAGVLLPLALFCLVLGAFGLGQLGDDFCLSRAPADAGSFRGPSLEGLPPTFVCEYRATDRRTVTTRHRLEPSAYLTAWLLGSTAVLAGAALALRRLRPTSPASRGRARPRRRAA